MITALRETRVEHDIDTAILIGSNFRNSGSMLPIPKFKKTCAALGRLNPKS